MLRTLKKLVGKWEPKEGVIYICTQAISVGAPIHVSKT